MMILVPGLAPRFYRRRHLAVLAATRWGFFALPILRDPEDVQWVLKVWRAHCRWRVEGWARRRAPADAVAACSRGGHMLTRLPARCHAPLPVQSQPSDRVLGLVADVFSLTLGERCCHGWRRRARWPGRPGRCAGAAGPAPSAHSPPPCAPARPLQVCVASRW